MNDPHIPENLLFPLIFLTAAVLTVPLFKRLGLGAVLGYLAAGVLIGPSVLGLFGGETESLMHVAEFGVVLFLFLIGLELDVKRLWAMRRDILGLGSAQILLTGAACMLYPYFVVGESGSASIVAGLGLALSSTAFVMQTLEERRENATPHGKKAFSILLMQDISIVPLLAVVALLASSAGGADAAAEGAPFWQQALAMLAAVAAVILAGRYALNPMFRLLSRFGGREIMTAAALLVVVAAAVLMALVGVSMALGAFLAGVMLAESSYRHELEADIEPFRGLLLGLFFISVGMSVDLAIVAENWLAIAAGLTVYVTLKFAVVYGVVRAFGNAHPVAVRTSAYLAQGGEFGFVLFSAAVAAGVMAQRQASLLIALVTLSMALTPLVLALAPKLLIRSESDEEREEDFADANGSALIIGFGRVGQVVSQVLQARSLDVTLLDSDAERIDDAGRFGFKVYYGDGTRLDVLRAAGASDAKVFVVCIDDVEASRKCVEILQEAFPDTPLHVRAYDRRGSIWLRERGIATEVRETFESALLLGRGALETLGLPGEDALDTERQVRHADLQRLEAQAREGIMAGRDLFVRPEPLNPQAPSREDDDTKGGTGPGTGTAAANAPEPDVGTGVGADAGTAPDKPSTA